MVRGYAPGLTGHRNRIDFGLQRSIIWLYYCSLHQVTGNWLCFVDKSVNFAYSPPSPAILAGGLLMINEHQVRFSF